jgi:hypothetical protein
MAMSGVPSELKSPMAVDQPKGPAAVPSLNAGKDAEAEWLAGAATGVELACP